MSPLILYNGGLLLVDNKLATSQNCCCSNCSCDCYEVGVKGRWDNGTDPYADPNNEYWQAGQINDCGSGGASYGKLDYPVRIGGYSIWIDGRNAVVRQDGDSGCAGGGYTWPDAVLTFDSDGCPTGIDLGEPVFSCGDTDDGGSCGPQWGDWGGTIEERCQKFRQFLDDNPPEFNFRACPSASGACCIPELEPCVYVTGPCPEEGDCDDGFICNEDGNCQGFGSFPIGECPGAVTGDPVPAECQDGLTQSECEATFGTYHPDQTCADNPCPESDPCDNPPKEIWNDCDGCPPETFCGPVCIPAGTGPPAFAPCGVWTFDSFALEDCIPCGSGPLP